MALKEGNYVSEHATYPTTEEQDKTNVEKINTHIVDAKTIEVKETIQYTTETYTVKTSHSKDRSKGVTHTTSDEIEDLDRPKPIAEFNDKDSGSPIVESAPLTSFQNQEEPINGDGNHKGQYATYDYPRPSSTYENSGDELESTALYVDGLNDFDPALREYYLKDSSNSPKTRQFLQAQIQENSDNFQNLEF